MDTYELFQNCPQPKAGASDIEAWGTLEGGAGNNSVVKLGLFGYDITCLANYCALVGAGDNEYCPLVESRGLDGLAFGVQFEIDATSGSDYCAGFHNEENTDTAVCSDSGSYLNTYYWAQNYTVADDYFTGTTERTSYSTTWGYYGLSEMRFYETPYDALFGADITFESGFRFIGANENGGKRWSVGDSIDMFYLDFENEEVEQNPEFELGGATTLTLAAGGIALIAAVMM